MLDPKLLENYRIRREQDLENCRKNLSEKNFKSIEYVGHQLKGNGEMFGYPEISKLGDSLEKAAKLQNSAQITEALNTLEQWLATKR